MLAVKQRKTLLRQLRRSRELSLNELAADTGINVSTLSRGERGLIDFTPEQQGALAKYFKVSKDDLTRDAVMRTEVA